MAHVSPLRSIAAAALAFALSGSSSLAVTGHLLIDVDPGGPQGDGRGVAFDGHDLYYTISTDSNIYEMDPMGGPGSAVRTISIPPGDPRSNTANGPLAWDGHAIWVADSVTGLILSQVDPISGLTISTCDLQAFNPGHPALNGLSAPAGLEYHDGELMLSGDISRPGSGSFSSTVVVNPVTCAIRTWFVAPVGMGAPGYGTSGLSTDRNFLWEATPLNTGTQSYFFQTDLNGIVVATRPYFVAPSQVRDLAFDTTTFAGSCAIWAVEGSFYINGGPPPKVKKHHLLAFEVPCNQPPTCAAGGAYVAECVAGTGTVKLDGSGSSDPEGLNLGYSWSSDCPQAAITGGTATSTLTVSGFVAPMGCNADLQVTDVAGDSQSCAAGVQVVDTIPPVLTLPVTRSTSCVDPYGIPSSDPLVQQWLAGVSATDTCAGVHVVSDMPAIIPISCAPKAGTTIHFTATDDAGNVATGSSIFQVFDLAEPVINPNIRALTLTCPFDGPGGALGDSRIKEWLGAAQARDVCSVAPAVTVTLIGEKGVKCSPGKTVTLRLEAIDACGNSETQKAFVTMRKVKKVKP